MNYCESEGFTTTNIAAPEGIFDPETAIKFGLVVVDLISRNGKRLDTNEQFHLTPIQLSMLASLKEDVWASAQDLAFRYEMVDRVLRSNTSTDAIRTNSNQQNSSISTSKSFVRVLISNVRNVVGEEVIESKYGFGYRLKSHDSNASSELSSKALV